MGFMLYTIAMGVSLFPDPSGTGNVGAQIGITVPTVCKVSVLSAVQTEANIITIPRIQEFCNRAGYEILMNYDPAQLAGTVAYFAGNTVALDETGSVRLVQANHAVHRVSELRLEMVELPHERLSLSLQMRPL